MAEWPFQRHPPRSMQSYPMGYWLWLSSIQRCKPHNSFYVNPWNFILQAGLCVRVELHEAFSTSLPLSCQHQPDIENHRMRCSKPIKMQADNSKSEWKVPCCVICFSFGPSLFLWPLFLFFFLRKLLGILHAFLALSFVFSLALALSFVDFLWSISFSLLRRYFHFLFPSLFSTTVLWTFFRRNHGLAASEINK